MRTLAATVLILSVLSGVASAASPAAETASLDWPQYRGPTRNGLVPPGPKLLDSWPKDGPRLLWTSETLWQEPSVASGCGSVVVANGKAFIYAYTNRKADKLMITSHDLADAGWMEGVPDELARKVEEARKDATSPWWKKQGAEQAALIKEFIATLDPALGKKYGPWIERRLQWTGHPINNGALPWKGLIKLAAIQDKEFASFAEFEKQLRGGDWEWKWARGTGNALDVVLTNRAITFLDTIICLDASTGKTLWRKELPGAPVCHDLNSASFGYWVGASSTPTISDDKCYVKGSAGMYCLSVVDGSVVWQAKTGPSNSSPLVLKNVVFVPVPEATAYDSKTGQVVWRQPDLRIANSSFINWISGGKDHLLITAMGGAYDHPQGGTYCLDPANGKTLWHGGGANFETPTVAGENLLVSSGTEALKVTPEKVERLWFTQSAENPRGAGPLIYQDHVYLAGACHSGKALSCLDLKTGLKKWNPTQFCAESSSPVLADGKIIAPIEEDEGSFYVLMYKASPEKFEELGRFNPHVVPGSSPAIAGGKMYLRLKDTVACYDITQYGPYIDKTTVTKDMVIFSFKQTEGGLVAKDARPEGGIAVAADQRHVQSARVGLSAILAAAFRWSVAAPSPHPLTAQLLGAGG